MKPIGQVFFFFWLCLLIAVPANAGPIGEPGPELWLDGPADVKLGPTPSAPDAAIDSRGRQIYVWDESTLSPEIQAKNIVLRVFDADGTSLVGPVQINTYLPHHQLYPRVAIASDDSFLVVWQSFEPPGNERLVVRSQAFDANGQPVGVEQLLSTLPTGKSISVDADVAALKGGGYVVVWQSGNTPMVGDTSTTIQARLIAANGIPSAGQFQVNSTISGAAESHPAVAELLDGGFLVAWATPQVHGRRFMANGTPVGNDFDINSNIIGTETQLDATTNQDGRVLVVWRDSEDNSNSTEINGRMYSSTLTPLGNDFRINSLVTGAQSWPSVGDYAENGFFVVWESASSVGDDNEPNGIEGRIVTGNDQFGSAEMQINQWTALTQKFPSVGGRNGRIATVWTSLRNPESTATTVQGRGWSICGIFCDGFE